MTPAEILDGLKQGVRHTFAGLFNGARNPAWIMGNHFHAGKAECEWEWPEAWEALKVAGLIDYTLSEQPNHPKIGGTTTYVHWHITEHGWDVRKDDLKRFRERVDTPTAAREAQVKELFEQ